LSHTVEILNAKVELDKALLSFYEKHPNCKGEKTKVQFLILEISKSHTNAINIVNKALADTHEESDFFYNKNAQFDYCGTIENFIITSLKLSKALNSITKKENLSATQQSKNAYITMQRFLNTFADDKTIEEIKAKFITNNISTTGFNEKFKRTMKSKFIKLQLWVGIPLLLVCGATILFTESLLGKPFNGIQLIFLKGFFALTISIVASSLIEGSARVNWTMQQGLVIRAAGWVAVFLLLYFLNPASPGEVH
jgi:hypothetical protein